MQAIAEYFKNSTEIRVNRVISNKSATGGLDRASKLNLPTDYIDYQNKSRKEFELDLLASVEKGEPDIIILAGFMRVLTRTFLNNVTCPILNIHPSLLPKHKGARAIENCIDSGDKISGISIHKVTEELDAGPIIFQVPILLEENESYDSLHSRIRQLEHYYFPRVIEQFINGC